MDYDFNKCCRFLYLQIVSIKFIFDKMLFDWRCLL
jgi:hypothetical protein